MGEKRRTDKTLHIGLFQVLKFLAISHLLSCVQSFSRYHLNNFQDVGLQLMERNVEKGSCLGTRSS